MSPAKFLVLLSCASLSTASIHASYRPEPDFTPLISFFPPSAHKGLQPNYHQISPPNLNSFNYIYGSNQPSSNYYTATYPQLPSYPQLPNQQHQSSYPPTPTILSSVSNTQPTYSYSGGLGNLGSLQLTAPVLNNFGSYSYLFPTNSYQSYLFDPFQPQQLQPSHQSKPLSPPFGFIEKQHRDPFSNPSDFVRSPPPKALMTTATQFLGLNDDDFNEKRESPHQDHQRRKPPALLSFNHFDNMANSEYTYYHGGPRGSKKGLVTQLKVLNGTEEIEVEAKRKQNNYVSEPILPPSILSLSNKWDDKDYDNYVKMEQPRNIIRNNKGLRTSPDEQEKDFDNDEIELNVDELMDGVSGAESKRSYHCPRTTTNDLLDLDDGSNPEVYADASKCNQFYYCKLGKAYVFKCPVNRYFNPYLKACEVDTDFACALTLKK